MSIRLAVAAVLCAGVLRAQDRTMPPEVDRQLARSIYKGGTRTALTPEGR